MNAGALLWRLVASVVSRPRVVAWLIARAKRTPYEHIVNPDDGSLYMGRWWLFNAYDRETHKTLLSWCPISVRIHHIMRPDSDRHLHDHPWNARTIILDGSYVEERDVGRTYLRLPGDTATLRFGEFHRIARVSEGGVWTLFITGKYRGTWGFKVDGVKVPYKTYLGIE